ncbi:signal peptide peptidase SppA [Chelativorans sp. YIM 93263]|uniref:signal peptide peptidase SppA n=1 Tax=Chelativorans sp. YIM 93263 TaxID=2906648 RepID=UPI0023789E8E|nr:signal peptide peptidase SppA [Chelativorans sp. YIM 93263]
MSTRADDLIDRRRLRRKLTFWRVAVFLILGVILVVAGRWLFGDALTGTSHIARVHINGAITGDEEMLDLLKRLRESEAAQGAIITVDSPGGTTVGGEAYFEEIRRLADEKPVVAQIGTLGTSAGYMVASAADHIVARQSSIVGSIGVIVQYPDVTELLDKLGIQVEEVKSSPLKAEPSPFNPTTDEERQMLGSMVRDSYDWFVDIVTARRPLSRQEVLTLADGAVFTGRQAMDNKLVDSVGGPEEAKNWLVSQGLSEELNIVEWKPRDTEGSLFLPGIAGTWLAGLFGIPTAEDLLRQVGAERLFLDGLLSVWQPEKS